MYTKEHKPYHVDYSVKINNSKGACNSDYTILLGMLFFNLTGYAGKVYHKPIPRIPDGIRFYFRGKPHLY
jgi:hypothetical protein